ncbi:hypothetical protein WAK64_07520 [Bacillus spongiae]|uniref:DUF3139 domain-containing protein n=1 Tax=Bacillus spongiae TaxID=2683610 RepID=A0ABU8HCD4_9BACI
MSKVIKNKKTALLSIPLLIIFLASFSYFIYVYTGEKTRYDEVFRYLTVEKSYKDSDITKIEAEHSILDFILSYEPWSISVVFNDEPNAIYYYHYNKGEITQDGISGYTENEIFKHYEEVEGGVNKTKSP